LQIPELSLDRPQDSSQPPTIIHTKADRDTDEDDDEINRGVHEVDDSGDETDDDRVVDGRRPPRRLSTYESDDGFDPEIVGARVKRK